MDTPNPYRQLSAEELQQKELSDPRDPVLKLEVARRYACGGEWGLAVETWQWVVQFAPQSSNLPAAQRWIAATSDEHAAKTDLRASLRCSDLSR